MDPLRLHLTSANPERCKSKRRNVAEQTIAIIGMGYVGLPLALQFAQAGVKVIGIDVDSIKVECINRGRSYISHIPHSLVANSVKKKLLLGAQDFSPLADVGAIIICLPTPLTRHREPDISSILEAGGSISKYLRRNMLVVLESTTFPGTTEESLRVVLEQGSGLKAGIDFHLGYSPEREDPGNPNSNVRLVPKVISGYTPICLKRAIALYATINRQLVPVSSCRVAEASKLLENVFRGVNIALVNELKIVYAAMGIDIWEVIDAAKTKPFGFMPFYPGPGLGGHCIPIDPFYLTWKAREFGINTRFIELAGEINAFMPTWVVGQIINALNARGISAKGSKILVLGITYKKNVQDLRESPALTILWSLKNKGASVAYSDPFIPELRSGLPSDPPLLSVSITAKTLAFYDCVVLATNHDQFDYPMIQRHAQLVVDTRGVYRSPYSNIIHA